MSQSERLTDVNELSGTEKEHLKNYILNNRIIVTDVRQYCEFFPDIWPVIDNRKLAIYNIIKDSVKNRGKHGFVDRA